MAQRKTYGPAWPFEKSTGVVIKRRKARYFIKILYLDLLSSNRCTRRAKPCCKTTRLRRIKKTPINYLSSARVTHCAKKNIKKCSKTHCKMSKQRSWFKYRHFTLS